MGTRSDFTENLEAVAQGVRRLEEIRDPILREAVAAALRLRERTLRLDPISRARIRNTVLARLVPGKPTLADHLYGLLALVGKPAPVLVRGLVIAGAIVGVIGSATVASADALPDEPLHGLKVAGEQLRLAVAIGPEDRASVELSIAEHRLDEAERLAESGREDDAIIATAAYGASLADAAADLASIESADPGTTTLVSQIQATLTASQQRVAATATRLATDPRTAGTAEVLAAVAATPLPSRESPATRIADRAVAITAQLREIADAHARLVDPSRAGAPRSSAAPRTDPATAPAAARPTASPERTAPDGPRATRTPSANPSSARQAADKAREAAEKALLAAEKAKRSATRTPSPSPTRR